MSEIKQIEEAVKKLPKEELKKFSEWFTSYEAEIWDKEFADHVKEGKFDKMANEAITHYEKGNFKEI